jgi:hypothetical protein
MPRKSQKQRFMNMVDNGYSAGQAAVALMRRKGNGRKNFNTFARSMYNVGDNFASMVKTRKGGVARKQGRYVFVQDKFYPYNMNQFNSMTERARATHYRNQMTGNQRRQRGQTIAMKQMNAIRNTRMNNSRSPTMQQAAMVNFTHTESISGIIGNGGGTNDPMIYTYQINPGLRGLLPWGAQVAYNFLYYRIVKMQFRLVSTCASTSTGRWAIGCDYDPYYDTTAVRSVDNIMQLNGKQGDVKDHIVYLLKPGLNKKNAANGLLIRGGQIPESDDLREYDFGNLYIGIESTDNSQLGNLEISYTVVFVNARPNVDSLSSDSYSQGTIFNQPFQNVVELSPNVPIIYKNDSENDAALIQFVCPYKGLMEMYVNGVGMSGAQGGFSIAENDSPYVCTGSTETINVAVSFIRTMGTTTDMVTQWWVDALAGGTIQFIPNDDWYNHENPDGALNLLRFWLTPATDDLKDNSGNTIVMNSMKRRSVFNPIMPIARLPRAAIRQGTQKNKRPDSEDDNEEQKYPQEESPEILILNRKSKKKQPGIDTYIKGGNCDEHALLLILCLLLCVAHSQIYPPYTKRPTQPTTVAPSTLRPTKSPTPKYSKFVPFKSSYVTAYGTSILPLNQTDDLVTREPMFAKINSTDFYLNHTGAVVITALFQVEGSNTLGTPPFNVQQITEGMVLNYMYMSSCDKLFVIGFYWVEITNGKNHFHLTPDTYTSGNVLSNWIFTPLNQFSTIGINKIFSVSTGECSVDYSLTNQPSMSPTNDPTPGPTNNPTPSPVGILIRK